MRITLPRNLKAYDDELPIIIVTRTQVSGFYPNIEILVVGYDKDIPNANEEIYDFWFGGPDSLGDLKLYFNEDNFQEYGNGREVMVTLPTEDFTEKVFKFSYRVANTLFKQLNDAGYGKALFKIYKDI